MYSSHGTSLNMDSAGSSQDQINEMILDQLIASTGPVTLASISSIDGKMTSFEKETESLYAAGEVVEAAPAVASMSSRWNADLCGSLDAAPNTPSPTTLALSPMIMVKPEEVTGQHVQAVSHPEVKVEAVNPLDEDGDVVLPDEISDMIDHNFDISQLIDNPLAESTMIGETQETIESMGQFLSQYEAQDTPMTDDSTSAMVESSGVPSGCLADQLLGLEQRQTLSEMMEESHEGGMGEVIETSLTDEEAAQAEELLDAILGNTNNPQGAQATQSTPQATDILQAAMDSQGLNDSGYQTFVSPGETTLKLPVVKSGSKVYQVANVSRCMTADGQQVIIVVQRPSDDRAPAAPSVTATPAPIPTLRKPAPAVKLLPKQPQAYSSGDEGDDPSWTPSPVSTQPKNRKPGRQMKPRTEAATIVHKVGAGGSKVAKRSYKHIKDPKEKKRWQNVEAARRYRDRKNKERLDMQAEEEKEKLKNKKLREKFREIQNEVNTMKGLMKELGLFKQASSRSSATKFESI